MQTTLNIGLAKSVNFPPNGEPLTVERVLNTLALNGFTVVRHRVAHSATEQTVIVQTETSRNLTDSQRPGFLQALHSASAELSQDCIAWQSEGGSAGLTGPFAEQWGAFNPDFFLPF